MRGNRWNPCWKFVDERYRDWNPLIPKLHEEVEAVREGEGKVGGEIANVLVKEFKDFAKLTIPKIKSIDGG